MLISAVHSGDYSYSGSGNGDMTFPITPPITADPVPATKMPEDAAEPPAKRVCAVLVSC